MSAPALDTLDKRILMELQGDLGDSAEPYARIADDLAVSEQEVIRRVRRMADAGVIRRMGAMIRHIEAGIGFNGMIVWRVPAERVDEVGRLLAAFPEVTHCYERPPFGEKGGRIFTMVHAETEEGALAIVRRMAEAARPENYEILFSEQELKKVSMTYFVDDDFEDDPEPGEP